MYSGPVNTSLSDGIDRMYVTKIYDNFPISISSTKGIAIVNVKCINSIHSEQRRVKCLYILEIYWNKWLRRTDIISVGQKSWTEKMPEAVVQKSSIKKVSPKSSQNSKDLAQVFSCEFCEIFKNTFFHRTPLVIASEYFSKGIYIQRTT